jgi:hypothetical protein
MADIGLFVGRGPIHPGHDEAARKVFGEAMADGSYGSIVPTTTAAPDDSRSLPETTMELGPSAKAGRAPTCRS